MADKSIFILGASRGIGLGLVKTFLDRGWNVVASERSESADLHALECDALRIVTADVIEPDSYVDLGFEDGQLDALIINAGITGASHQDASKATADEVSHVMMTNAFGPARAQVSPGDLPLKKRKWRWGLGHVCSAGFVLWRPSRQFDRGSSRLSAHFDLPGQSSGSVQGGLGDGTIADTAAFQLVKHPVSNVGGQLVKRSVMQA